MPALHTIVCATLIACGTPKRIAIPLLAAGQFDAATTVYMHNNCDRCAERNPVMAPYSKTPAMLPATWVGDNLTLYLVRRYSKRHQKMQKAIIIGVTVMHVYLGYHNIGLTKRLGH